MNLSACECLRAGSGSDRILPLPRVNTAIRKTPYRSSLNDPVATAPGSETTALLMLIIRARAKLETNFTQAAFKKSTFTLVGSQTKHALVTFLRFYYRSIPSQYIGQLL